MASASRRPPLASFRSGSSRNASSPLRAVRSACSTCSSASLVRAPDRQSARTPVRRSLVSPGSPATCRACSRPSATRTSWRATSRASAGRRTAWSSRVPESQMGYQTWSASAAIPGRPSCSSSTSRSLPGSSSRRPYPPTATSATPGSVPSSEASQRSALALRRARSAANEARCRSLAGRAPVATASKGSGPALAGADPYHRVHRGGPDLAIADPPGLRGLDHHADQVVGVLVVAEHLKPHLRHQVDLVLRAAVHLGVAALPAIAARLTDRHAVHAERLQSGLDVVQLEGLDHGGDELHATTSVGPTLGLSVPRGRFADGYGLFPRGETAGRHVTQMFRLR